jgi:hypothetical protein
MAHPAVRKLSFTGSTEVGRGLLKASADRVISTSMELDGNAPLIVLMSAVTTSRDVLRPALWSAGFSLGRIVVGAEDDDLIATIAAEDAYEERLDPAAVRGAPSSSSAVSIPTRRARCRSRPLKVSATGCSSWAGGATSVRPLRGTPDARSVPVSPPRMPVEAGRERRSTGTR